MKGLSLDRYALSAGVALALLAGCGGTQPIGAPGAMPPSTDLRYTWMRPVQSTHRPHRTVHYLYVANYDSDDVSAYAINANSGALTQVKGSPFATGSFPFGVAINPAGTFAYVTNAGDDNVSTYAINARSGALAPLKGSPFSAGRQPEEVAIDPSGRFAYVTNSSGWNVSAFAVNAISGALTRVEGSPFKARSIPGGVAIR